MDSLIDNTPDVINVFIVEEGWNTTRSTDLRKNKLWLEILSCFTTWRLILWYSRLTLYIWLSVGNNYLNYAACFTEKKRTGFLYTPYMHK